LIPNQQAEDAMVSNYSIEAPTSQMRRAQWVKQKLESSKTAKIILFTLTILGTSMVMGDGTLTPSISGNGNREPRLGKSMIVSQPVCRICTNLLFFIYVLQCSLQ
jgi:K+ transporter